MMRRRAAVASLLLVFVAGTLGRQELSEQEKARFFVQYAPTLYEAFVKAKLELTLKAIQALDLVHHYSNPLLAITFLALDDAAWRDLARHARGGLPVNKMMSDLPFVRQELLQVLQAHCVDFPFFTTYWPRPGEAARVDTTLPGRAIELLVGNGSTLVVAGYQNSGQLAATVTDLRAGASLLHVLSVQGQPGGGQQLAAAAAGGTQAGVAAAAAGTAGQQQAGASTGAAHSAVATDAAAQASRAAQAGKQPGAGAEVRPGAQAGRVTGDDGRIRLGAGQA